MRTTMLCSWVAAALVSAVIAVNVSDAQAQAGQSQQPKPHDMTGCLAKGDTATTWKLTNVEGGKVKTVEITETAADLKLAPHVGHKVTITGTAVPPPKDEKKPGGEHYMRVDAIKMVSTTCP
jgi:hypothetical protein